MDPRASGFLSVEAYMNACQILAERSKGSETPELSFQLRHEVRSGFLYLGLKSDLKLGESQLQDVTS